MNQSGLSDRDRHSSDGRSGEEPERTEGNRWTAALTAAFLLVTGAVLGIAIDRLWLRTPEPDGPPLTAEAMAESLELTSSEEARVRRVLDSLEVTISGAAGAGPDSLHAAAHRARMRLEKALPPRARPEFRRWMERHHRRMMEEMHGGGGHPHDGDGTESAHPDSATAMVRPRNPHLATSRSRPASLGDLLAAARTPPRDRMHPCPRALAARVGHPDSRTSLHQHSNR